MSLKYLLLGTLLERPYHGYELKTSIFQKTFKDFGINDGQLYPLLKKLEQEDLIIKTVQPQENLPARNVFAITDKGRNDFLNWLESNEGEEVSFRYDFFRKDPFFIRCNFIRYLSQEKAQAKISLQLEVVRNTIDDLTRAREAMIRKQVDPFRISILEYGLAIQQVREQWLIDFLAQLELNPGGE